MSNPQQRIISYYGASAVGNTTPTPSVGFTITDNTNILASNMIRQSIVPGLINQSIPDNLQVNTFIMSSYSTITIDNNNNISEIKCIFKPNIIIETDRFYHINANIVISTNENINYNTYDYNLRGTIICDLNTDYISSCNLGFYGKNDSSSNQPSTYKSTINDDILINTTLKILGSQTPSVPALSTIDVYPSSPKITLLFDPSFNYATTVRAIANITITSGTLHSVP